MHTLRSLMIGDCDFYFSPYIFGVNQAMSKLGHWHSQVNIRQDASVIAQRVADVKPDVLWTHMFMWGPTGAAPLDKLLVIAASAAKQGTKVIIHDGDYKQPTRHAQDISSWCALALCNHKFDRSAWKVPVLHWPYFAFAQEKMADPDPTLACDLFFAGSIFHDATYAARTQLLNDVRARGVNLRTPSAQEGNTLFRTPVIAASSMSVLGFGRPGGTSWVDTRVYQYTGAGAILVHDDAPGFEPWVHFAPYKSGSAESVAEAIAKLKAMSVEDRYKIRHNAFYHAQKHHSSVARVKQVLEFLYPGQQVDLRGDSR